MIDTLVYDALKSIASGGAFASDYPQGASLPLLVFSKEASSLGETHDGFDGTVEERWSVECFDTNYTGCRTLCQSSINAMLALEGYKDEINIIRRVVLDSYGKTEYDPDSNEYIAILEFTIQRETTEESET
jgi:hypothetical protein